VNLFFNLPHPGESKDEKLDIRVIPRQCNKGDTVGQRVRKHRGVDGPDSKKKNNLEYSRSYVSEIKLKRTDTTLDLSQKAKRAEEKKRGECRGDEQRIYSRTGGPCKH
jgi:hypothetical protein